MSSRFRLFQRFVSYYFHAENGKGHGMHSPFIYDFISKVLNDRNMYEAYGIAEDLRSKLKRDPKILDIEDFGAGSTKDKSNKRSIASITRNAAKSKKYGQLLFRIVRYYQPRTIIELGTSLGITTSYLSMANPDSDLITLEGSKSIAEVAKSNFDVLHLKNITLIEGNFDATLENVLNNVNEVNLAFIDGNHRQFPTENYFCQLLSKSTHDSIFIFDDIHWSNEMEAAWETIKNHPSVRCTVDLFFIGVVFFRSEFHEKQHFTIRY